MDTSSDSWLEFLTLEAPGESRKFQAPGWALPLGIFGHAPVFPPGFHLRGRKGKNTHKSHPHPSSLLQTWEDGPREGREKNKTPSARTAGDSSEQLTALRALEEGEKATQSSQHLPCWHLPSREQYLLIQRLYHHFFLAILFFFHLFLFNAAFVF